jgi:hypothetical protein
MACARCAGQAGYSRAIVPGERRFGSRHDAFLQWAPLTHGIERNPLGIFGSTGHAR